MEDVGDCGELEGEELALIATRLHHDFEVAWRDSDFDGLARLHAGDLRVESHRSIGQLSYVGIDEFRRQTWALRDLFPSVALTAIEVIAPAHVMSRAVFSDDGGSEVAMLIVQQVTDARISAVTTFDEGEEAEARAYMARVAELGPSCC